nr:hypothetical protein BaRGS_017023 [Batillaria attramentaria]
MTRYPNGSSNPSTGQGNVCINSGQNDAPAVTRYPKSNANPALWHSARLSEHPYDDEDDDEDVSDDDEEEEEDCEGDEDGDKDGDDEEGRIEEDAPPTLEETEDESGRVRLPGVAIELEDLGEGVAENGEIIQVLGQGQVLHVNLMGLITDYGRPHHKAQDYSALLKTICVLRLLSNLLPKLNR